jgi:translation initiation factor IF-3
VRLIDKDGSQLGVVPLSEALKISEDSELDLVEVAPQASPPVCRIMDYGKYKYQQGKREREARKKQKTSDVKEIRMHVSIDDHDFMVKAKHAEKFLEKGDKVKVSIIFRGREMGQSENGRKVLERFVNELGEKAKAEQMPKQEGRFMSCVVAPSR